MGGGGGGGGEATLIACGTLNIRPGLFSQVLVLHVQTYLKVDALKIQRMPVFNVFTFKAKRLLSTKKKKKKKKNMSRPGFGEFSKRYYCIIGYEYTNV